MPDAAKKYADAVKKMEVCAKKGALIEAKLVDENKNVAKGGRDAEKAVQTIRKLVADLEKGQRDYDNARREMIKALTELENEAKRR